YVLLLIVPMPLLYYKEIMFLSFLPPAVTNTVIARIYNWKPEIIASITLLLTLRTLVIVPFIMLVI
ncbi:MAG: transporter, partial [Staphylothermus sp.]|nr:transporter [Staphylothermus sp.]